MPKCSICCKRRKNVYQMCTTCTQDDAKRSCLECHANMLTMCPLESNCIALHKKCPYCLTPMSQKQLNASVLKTSVHFMKKASDLYLKQLSGIVADRFDLYGVIKSQKRLIEFFRDHVIQRLGNNTNPSPAFHFEYILAHVSALLEERGLE